MRAMPFADAFAGACDKRLALSDSRETTAYRLFDGSGDGLAGIYVDRYGPAAVLGVYEDSGWHDAAITDSAETILAALKPSDLEAVYV